MDTASFEAALRRDGYAEILTRDFPADSENPTHTHPFDLRALVLEGEIEIELAGGSRRYGAGEVFELGRDVPHVERIGARGVRFLTGRRQ